MSSQSLSKKQRFINSIVFGYGVTTRTLDSLIGKFKRILFYQNRKITETLADPLIDLEQQHRPKVLIGIAHITSPQESQDFTGVGADKVERLRRTLDGLLSSFAHCDLKITVHTLPGRNIVNGLPLYQQECIDIISSPNCDPMYVGYRIQDELVTHVNEYDWFMLIEDDIVISDGWFLNKIEKFNHFSGRTKYLLFPNRYEMDESRKSYIDITIDHDVAWDRTSAIQLDGVKFAQCTNPHSGMYCLSRSQLEFWIKSGRSWNNQAIMVGPLESAATFCLMECFTIYKPHPQNLNYLEVGHFDTKYSKMYPGSSPFIVSAIPSSKS